MGDLNETVRVAAAVVSGLVALVCIFLAVRPVWRAPNEPLKRAWAAGAAVTALACGYFFFDLIRTAGEEPRWFRAGFITLAIALGVLGASLFVAGAWRIVRAASGRDAKFAEMAGYCAAGSAILILAFAAGIPAGWWDTPFDSSFEVILIAAATIASVLFSWGTRAWANAGDDTTYDSRSRMAFNLSLVFASAIGVLVFVSIGASAFAARLAQREIMGMQDQTASVPLERIQETVQRLILLDRRLAIMIEREGRQEQSFYDSRNSPDELLVRFERGQFEFWADATRLGTLLEAYNSPAAVEAYRAGMREVGALRATSESGMPPFEAASSIVLSALHRAIREIEEPRRAELLTQLARLDASRQTTHNDHVSAMRAADRRDHLRDQILGLQSGQACEIHRLATDITQGKNQTDQQRQTQERMVDRPDGCQGSGQTYATDLAAARRLVGAARPLGRSFMSHALARRAPITLSIELVLVMGALGALLQSISLQLIGMVRAPTSSSSTGAPPPTTLISLSLHIVFGMATALALFVLLNMAIGASSLSVQDNAPRGDDLDPFAMAAVGLLGGFAALNVAEWMRKTADDLLRRPAAAAPAPQPQPAPQPHP